MGRTAWSGAGSADGREVHHHLPVLQRVGEQVCRAVVQTGGVLEVGGGLGAVLESDTEVARAAGGEVVQVEAAFRVDLAPWPEHDEPIESRRPGPEDLAGQQVTGRAVATAGARLPGLPVEAPGERARGGALAR